MAACAARRNFRNAQMLEFLWRAGLRTQRPALLRYRRAHARRASAKAASTIISAAASRAIRSTSRWLVPHFEKMLYDNAQLLELLALAYARSGKRIVPHARARNRRLARPRDDHGGGRVLAPRSTPISEGEEGKFYVWSLAEMRADARRGRCCFFAAALRRDRRRQFRRPQHSQSPARTYRAAQRTKRGLRRCAQNCSQVREGRIRPGLDDKVLADWNGLMIAALVNAGVLLDEPAWIDTARRAFDAIAAADGTRRRPARPFLARGAACWCRGLPPTTPAMVRAALALYEATGDGEISRQRAGVAERARRALFQRRRRRAISSPPTTPKAWWCGRNRRSTKRSPIRTA